MLRYQRIRFTYLIFGVVLACVTVPLAAGQSGATSVAIRSRAARVLTQPSDPCPPGVANGTITSQTTVTAPNDGSAIDTVICGLPDRSTWSSGGSASTSGNSGASFSGSSGASPLVNNPGSDICNPSLAWTLITGGFSYLCAAGFNTNWNSLPEGTLELANDTGVRVWLHQYANWQTQGGWADCFDWGDFYELGGRDIVPANMYISGNSAPCSGANGGGNQSTNFCPYVNEPFAALLNHDSTSEDQCFQTTGTYSANIPIDFVLNGYLARVWLKGNLVNDCIDNGHAQYIYNTAASDADEIQTTDTFSPC